MDVQIKVAGAAHDLERVGGLEHRRDQREGRHGRPLLDARHHHPRPRQLLQARDPQSGRRPRNQALEATLLQSQV